MPFWNRKKKTNSKSRVMMCPNCHGQNLRQTTSIGIVLGLPRLICPDCGYNGVVYVDFTPTDEHEDDIEIEFLRENPDFLTSRKNVRELAQESLNRKWIPEQRNNQHTLREWCPFCADVEVICKICVCPTEICGNHATTGYIGELNKLYDDNVLLCDVDPIIYQQIVQRFQSIVNSEDLRTQTTNKS